MGSIVTQARTTSTTVTPSNGDRHLTVDTRHGTFTVTWSALFPVGAARISVEQDASVYANGFAPTAYMHVGTLQVRQLAGAWSPSHLMVLAAAVDHWVLIEEQLQSEAEYADEADGIARDAREVDA